MSTALESLRILLPPEVVAKYEATAKAQGRSLTQILQQQLTRFAHIQDEKPIILGDTERRSLDQLLGRNLDNGAHLVNSIQRAMSVQLDHVDIPISPHLLERLRTRCIGMEWPKFLQ